MPEQEQGAGEIEASEETTADAEGTDSTAPSPTPLNREQRRAKGKKGGTAFNPGSGGAPHMHGPGNIAGGGIRFQRKTGGK